MKAELYIRCSCVNGEGPVWDEARPVPALCGCAGQPHPHLGKRCAHHRGGGGEHRLRRPPAAAAGWWPDCSAAGTPVDLKTGEKQFLCDPEPNPRTRCNDGKADPFGNLWIGCMSRSLDSGAGEAQPEAGLYCMTPDGQVKTMLTGLYLGNGLAWSGDGRKFYYIDTMLHNVQVFDFDPDTVTLSNGREAFAIPAELGLPDGMTIDCEGKLWIAMFGGRGRAALRPGHRRPSGPGGACPAPTSPAPASAVGIWMSFSSPPGAQGTDLSACPLAGSVFRVKAGIKGAPSYSFRG